MDGAVVHFSNDSLCTFLVYELLFLNLKEVRECVSQINRG